MKKERTNNKPNQTRELLLTSSLNENVSKLKAHLEPCDDLIFHTIPFKSRNSCFVYLSNMVDSQRLYEIERSLLETFQKEEPAYAESMNAYVSRQFPFHSVSESKDGLPVIEGILSGKAVLLIDKSETVVYFDLLSSVGREVSEPDVDRTVMGPKEGFVEKLETNLHLIRKRLRTPSLKVEQLILGKETRTQISILYVKGIASEGLVKEVQERLGRIDIDGVIAGQYLESMISDAPFSPFPTMINTDRPDRVTAELLEGKVAILTDGDPLALLAPVTFVEFLHSTDDYYTTSLIATFVRWVRFLGLFVALILPAFFVAVTSFHQDLLQTPFLIRIAANRANLPYPSVVEGLFMYLTYELLREAGLRMPKIFGGPLLTLLGLIFISQAGVNAGVIGPVMSIAVSTTALTAFIVSDYNFHQVIRFSGIPLLLLAGMFGFMGILIGLMFGLAHLVSLRSFGVPYFSPVSPARKKGWKDVFIRAPWWAMDTRPPGLDVGNLGRSDDTRPPSPPKVEED